jgi:hypothetical protein
MMIGKEMITSRWATSLERVKRHVAYIKSGYVEQGEMENYTPDV